MDVQLSEMPVTQYSASEVSRLYLNSKLQVLTAYSEDRQLQQILETLEHEELYNLTPEEKLKVLCIDLLKEATLWLSLIACSIFFKWKTCQCESGTSQTSEDITPQSWKILQTFVWWGHGFVSFPQIAFKLGNFTNFKALFPAESTGFSLSGPSQKLQKRAVGWSIF